jgi:mono/diheme cytochrome c family protein
VSWRSSIAIVGLSVSLAACDNMANQPKLNPYELPYGSQLKWPVTPVPHTVARDEPLKPPSPPPVTMALLERGQQRFDIYCSPCHSRIGDGNGIIVQRGFPHPPSYDSDALRNAPNQLFYDVITHGYGAMYSYADRVEPADRWAIVAYIRALQASARASLSDVPAEKRSALQ